MAHGTRISGTNKAVTAGFTRISGVNKKIAKGLTLVDGVQKDIRFEVAPEGATLNECSWRNISEISSSGMASNFWDVGDTKTITINGKAGVTTFSNLSVKAFIIGFDHNSAVEGANLTHFQIGKIGSKDVCLCDEKYNTLTSTAGEFSINISSSAKGGWKSSNMRKKVLGSDSVPTSPTANTLLSCLPSDLRAVMQPIIKYSDNTVGGSDAASDVTATTDYLPLLAEFEVFGTRTYANSAEQNKQKQYQYYKSGKSPVKYKHNSTGTAATQALRSYARGTGICCYILAGGTVSTRSPRYSHGIAPCFAA